MIEGRNSFGRGNRWIQPGARDRKALVTGAESVYRPQSLVSKSFPKFLLATPDKRCIVISN